MTVLLLPEQLLSLPWNSLAVFAWEALRKRKVKCGPLLYFGQRRWQI